MAHPFLFFYALGSTIALILSLYILSKTKIEDDNKEIGGAIVSLMVLSWVSVFYLIQQIINGNYN